MTPANKRKAERGRIPRSAFLRWLALAVVFPDTKDQEVRARATALVNAVSGEPKQYAQLIKDLSANDYATREAAGNKLIEIGKPVLRAVREAAQSEDLEVRRRAESVIKTIEKR